MAAWGRRGLASDRPAVWFEVLHESKAAGSNARVGRLHTPHGSFFTPGFVPVATNGSIKALSPAQMREEVYEDDGRGEAAPLQSRTEVEEAVKSSRTGMVFCNTYHLLVHPGPDVVAKAGGLHRFTGHRHPLITDSGGFQVFSLAYGSIADERKSGGSGKAIAREERDGSTDTASVKRQKRPQFGGNNVMSISEDGVKFRSYRDGNVLLLTPESSIQAQKQLGADVIIPLDELPPHHISRRTLRDSFDRTHRWQERSLAQHLANPNQQAIFGVVHGGTDVHLRRESVNMLSKMGFDGFAIGGSLGKDEEDVYEVTRATMEAIEDREKPVHLLGIGDLPSIARAVPLGVDTFDSSYPTRAARHGNLYTAEGLVSVRKAQYREDFTPVDRNCGCSTCRNHTRAYLHHLLKAHEPSFAQLATVHNLHFYHSTMLAFRRAILRDLI